MHKAVDLEFANVSDTGLKRANNEDSVVTDPQSGLVLVADGMGGYKAGEVASAIAAKVVLDDVRAGLGRREFLQSGASEATLLKAAIESANRHIYETAAKIPQCRGMGTTIAAVLFSHGRATVAHVGDSRVYRLREGALSQVTTDHSLFQELIDKGYLTPEEAQATTPRNLVTRALGIDPEVKVDIQQMDSLPNDIFLICSDGLTDMVGAEDIHLTLDRYGANLQTAAQELVELANAGGGRDNVSVVLARPLPVKLAGGGSGFELPSLWSRGSR
jgi:protein phosphatase